MALVVADRVWETTSTSGTGTLTLSGAVSGYQTFAAIGDGNTTYYTITTGTDWEVGIGTYTSSGTTLSRDTVLSSSLGGTTKINVTPGSFVFVDYPASKAVYEDESGNVTVPTLAIDTSGTDAQIAPNTGITGWNYSGLSKSVSTEESNPTGLFLSPDGLNMYVNGSTGDDVNQYTLSTAWNVSTATFVRLFSTSAQDSAPNDIFFKPDGLSMFILGQTNDTVFQYTLSSAFDISTASYASKSFSVTTQETTPTGLWFKPDGTVMYVIGSGNDTVFQYTLSTAWDVSTASYSGISFSVAPQESSPQQVNLSADGTKMWVLGNSGDDIVEYTLGTAWNVSTATFVNNLYIGFQDITSSGLFIDSTADNRVYMVGQTNDTVFQYNTATNSISAVTDVFNTTSNARVQGNLAVQGNANIDGTLTVQGITTLTGTTTATTFSSSGTTTLATATSAQTVSLGAGATVSGSTKTLNIGTAGVSGSTTNINIGSAVSGSLGTTTIQAPTVNIGQTATQFQVTNTASAVNYLQTTGSLTGFGAKLLAAGTDTNIPLVLQPKGTGALQAQQTDSTATGGNVRGANAVDWQTFRSNANQVASGQYSILGGGNSNRSSAYGCFIGGGESNLASAFDSAAISGASNQASGGYSAVAGGLNNLATGQYSFSSGGYFNTASGYNTFIGGGERNSGASSSAVTTQTTTTVTSGSTAVTLSGSNASIKVGQLITGTGIVGYPNQTYVVAISGTSLTLSQNASASGSPTLSFFTPNSVVVGGGNNQATGAYSFIGGGGDAGTAANRNRASGDWSFVGGGGANTASGIGSVVCGGGSFGSGFSANTASGTSAFIGGGYGNTSTGFTAAVLGGNSNTANGNFNTVLGGAAGTTRSITSNFIFPSGNPLNSVAGASQAALLVLAKQTTDATATGLTSDTATPSTANQVILPNNSAYLFKATVISGVTGGGNTSGWKLEGVIKRGANAASTAIVGSVTTTLLAQDAGASGWVIAATADTTNGGLRITFTGQASTTIRTVAKVETTEVTY